MRVDLVPELAQPSAVTEAIAEANALRERVREAAELAAAAQDAVDEAEREDVERAAKAARSGAPLGTPPAQVAKLRSALEARKRDHLALTLAAKLAEEDVAETLTASAEGWAESLDVANGAARVKAVEALATLEAAAREVGDVRSATEWVRAGSDGGWDHRPASSVIGVPRTASSARISANGEPIQYPQLVAFLRELFEPPTKPPPMTLRVAEPDAATNAA